MENEFRTIALIGKYQSPEIADSLRDLVIYLREQGRQVLVEAGTEQSVGSFSCPTASYAEIGAQADLAIILGGDGTMLNAARQLARNDVHNLPCIIHLPS